MIFCHSLACLNINRPLYLKPFTVDWVQVLGQESVGLWKIIKQSWISVSDKVRVIRDPDTNQ